MVHDLITMLEIPLNHVKKSCKIVEIKINENLKKMLSNQINITITLY